MGSSLNTGKQYKIDLLGITAELQKIYTVQSKGERPLMYALAENQIALINSGGAIRLELTDILTFCEEIPEIIKDYHSYVRECKPRTSLNKLFKTKEK